MTGKRHAEPDRAREFAIDEDAVQERVLLIVHDVAETEIVTRANRTLSQVSVVAKSEYFLTILRLDSALIRDASQE